MKVDQHMLLAFEMRGYRGMLEIKWQHHITNDEVRSRVQREWTVIDTVRKRKLQMFGHICRMSDDRLLKTLMLGWWKANDNRVDLHGGGLTTS